MTQKNIFKTVVLICCLAASTFYSQAEPAKQKPEDRKISINYVNNINADQPARKTAKGIIIVGTGKEMRALEPFSGTSTSGYAYADVVNEYKRVFGDKVNVYCMPIPTAAAFYTPNAAKGWSRDVKAFINGLFEHLDDSVYCVDIYTPLSQHVDEHIYSRTDHHWAPLGGYYAAQKLAEVAGVPFKDISNYDVDTVHNYVGTMPMFSGDASLKKAPEDFIYYKPRNVEYTTTYINYKTKGLSVISQAAPKQDKFFYNFQGTSAYCTFMGGDTKIVKVQTSTKNGRHILFIKDSFGNAVPGYLFYSFEEIHVIDSRYFNKNMKQYVKDNNITDIVLDNNITHMGMKNIRTNILKYLNQ
ncbi:MAG: hypothetical protein IKX31_07130 [Muribaculaceae bacterium]|nr:hypothetical protein [Muribaculaceae bacterium]